MYLFAEHFKHACVRGERVWLWFTVYFEYIGSYIQQFTYIKQIVVVSMSSHSIEFKVKLNWWKGKLSKFENNENKMLNIK